MNEPPDSVYPDFLRSGLERLSRLDARSELPALFLALEHFRRDLHGQDTAAGVLNVSQGYIDGLKLFSRTGFWTVSAADFNFELSPPRRPADGPILQRFVNEQIKGGRFAFALRQGAPVFFGPTSESGLDRGVLHSLAISTRVMGMFCGLLRPEIAPAQQVAFSLLTTMLGMSADALDALRRTRQLTSQIETLQGLLPICAWCKKVRNDSGYWYQIEKYIAQHSNAQITHGICPECKDKFLANVR
jgi:hypothetical protein